MSTSASHDVEHVSSAWTPTHFTAAGGDATAPGGETWHDCEKPVRSEPESRVVSGELLPPPPALPPSKERFPDTARRSLRWTAGFMLSPRHTSLLPSLYEAALRGTVAYAVLTIFLSGRLTEPLRFKMALGVALTRFALV